MNNLKYLEELPMSSIARYSKGEPKDGVPFIGYPRVHPFEKNKLFLVSDPLGAEPLILEFIHEDILSVEELPSVITEDGESIPLIKLWIQKGATGMILEPFEVNDSTLVSEKFRTARNGKMHNWSAKEG